MAVTKGSFSITRSSQNEAPSRRRDWCRCESSLALHGCGFRSGLLRLDRGVDQTVAAFDQFFQPLSETCCRSSIDQIMIEAQGQAEVVTDDDVPVDDAWILSDTTQGKIKGTLSERDAPTSTFAKHPHCRHAYRPAIFFLHLGNLPVIHHKTGQTTLKTTGGRNRKYLK